MEIGLSLTLSVHHTLLEVHRLRNFVGYRKLLLCVAYLFLCRDDVSECCCCNNGVNNALVSAYMLLATSSTHSHRQTDELRDRLRLIESWWLNWRMCWLSFLGR